MTLTGWHGSPRPVTLSAMPFRLRRTLLSAVLAFGLIGTASATHVAAATPSASWIAAGEETALRLANAERTRRGLVPLRLDPRVADVARERSAYMAATGRFSHAHSGGADAFDLLTR